MSGRRFRLALYGFVDRQAGSVASANWMLIDGLLARGHEIDLFAIDGFIHPRDFDGRHGYRYFTSKVAWAPAMWSIANRAPAAVKSPVMTGCSWLVNPSHMQRLGRMVQQRHLEVPYDALIAMGLNAPFTVRNLPTISWPQGPTTGEAKGIESQRETIVRYEGWMKYRAISMLYARRVRKMKGDISQSDALICGSNWARQEWVEMGADAKTTFAIPYPYDLSMYSPKHPTAIGDRPITFVWLGRVVPRKRLDLALDALRIVLKTCQARLKIFGRFSYVPRFQKMLSEANLGAAVEYQPWIARSETPSMLQEADVLLQPSEFENLGSGPLEALACGTPVILGPTNGTRDYICSNSIVFEAYNAQSVAAAMLKMIDRLRGTAPESICATARAAAERSVNLAGVLDAVEDVLQRTVQRS